MRDFNSETKEKLLACDCLKAMKKNMTYRDLSRKINLPAGVISRYVNGYVLPNRKRAKEIIGNFNKTFLSHTVLQSSKIPGSKYFSTTSIMGQPFLLNLIAWSVKNQFQKRITKVLTAASDGIPLAIALGSLLNIEACWIKKEHEVTKYGYYVSQNTVEKAISLPFCIPKNLLKSSDSVILIDDVVRGGSTISSLIDICNQAHVEIAGIFAIFMSKKSKQRFADFPSNCLIEI